MRERSRHRYRSVAQLDELQWRMPSALKPLLQFLTTIFAYASPITSTVSKLWDGWSVYMKSKPGSSPTKAVRFTSFLPALLEVSSECNCQTDTAMG